MAAEASEIMQNGHDTETMKSKKPRSMTDLELFDEAFPELVQLLCESNLKDAELAPTAEWFQEVLQYNVPHGKKNRGLFVVLAYKYLVQHPTEDDLHIARVLGWCIEMLQAFFLVADDIMDQSLTRRGRPCWYKKENVGLEAINDSIYLESAIYKLLKHHIRDKPYYVSIMELFHEITLNTVKGQCLDMTVAPPQGCVDFTKYTLEKYKAIVKWKTAFYSFYLPVAIAMYMAGIDDEESHSSAKSILLRIGEYFQIQDDYLDCYGDPKVVGKIGTDIQDNKCSWLVIQALENTQSSPEQRHILMENYGKHDEEKVQRIKQLYNDLDLEKAFQDFEESSYTKILSLIDAYHGKLPKDLFIAFTNKIYKRAK